MIPPALRRFKLLTQTQLGDNRAVTLDILLFQVIEQVSAMSDHFQQAAVGMEILRVLLHMLGQGIDAAGEYGDLHFGRAGVAFVGCVLGNDLVFLLFENHVFHLINYLRQGPGNGAVKFPQKEHPRKPRPGHINLVL